MPRPPSPEALGRAIRESRGDRLTQAQLADRAGISRVYMNGIESGSQNPSYRVLCDIAEALGMTLSELAAEAERAASSGKR